MDNDKDSLLQEFNLAKEKINDIFIQIQDYSIEAMNFIRDQDNKSIIENSNITMVDALLRKIETIRNVLCRDHMKIVFFGRTSNGKSTVINALLRDKILPSGYGHTTSCFLQIEGTDENEEYLKRQNSDNKHNVEDIKELADALSDLRLEENELVNIFWPREKCHLLRNDVVFVDTPGCDSTLNLDELINDRCMDADMFVLVVNSESGLSISEKKFFNMISAKLSLPNVFILNNKWDGPASVPTRSDKLRIQQTTDCCNFLAEELKVYSLKEAEDRIFFISAKEAVIARLNEKENKPSSSGVLTEGFQDRYLEFRDFERKYQKCISQSAIKTKFEKHFHQGNLIVTDVKYILEKAFETANTLHEEKLADIDILRDDFNRKKRSLKNISTKMKNQIENIRSNLRLEVASALKEEIRHLSSLVEDFTDMPFPSNLNDFNVYKRLLHFFVDTRLNSKLNERLLKGQQSTIELAHRNMEEMFRPFLPQAGNNEGTAIVRPRRRNLSPVSYLQEYELPFSDFRYSRESDIVQQNAAAEANAVVAVGGSLGAVVARVAGASIAAGTAVASAVVGTIVLGKYIFQNFIFPNEMCFKEEYVKYVTSKLTSIVNPISQVSSSKIVLELSTALKIMVQLADRGICDDHHEKFEKLKSDTQILKRAATTAEKLNHKANYLNNELSTFNDAFLKKTCEVEF